MVSLGYPVTPEWIAMLVNSLPPHHKEGDVEFNIPRDEMRLFLDKVGVDIK